MKANVFVIALFTMIGFTFATHSYAQTAPKVTNTQLKQQKRIVNGVQTGELTRKEARKLQRQQTQIQRSKKRAKADGVVTPRERAKLNARQRKASADIRRQKTDRQERR
ncbi:MAG: hypothetical protein AAF399_17395 [Bacteroidota bacterium]